MYYKVAWLLLFKTGNQPVIWNVSEFGSYEMP